MLKNAFFAAILLSICASAGAQLKPQLSEVNVPVVSGSGTVTSPQVGALIYDTSDNFFKGYTQAGSWTSFTPSPWLVSGNDLYYTAGYIGIGSAPATNWGLTINKSNGGLIYMEVGAGNSTQMALTDNSNWLEYIGVENGSGSGVIGTGDPYAFVIGTTGSQPLDLFTNGVKRIKIDGGGDVHAYGALAADGGLQLTTSGSQPTCDSGHRGMQWLVQGGTGVADVVQTCIKNASDVYVWQ